MQTKQKSSAAARKGTEHLKTRNSNDYCEISLDLGGKPRKECDLTACLEVSLIALNETLSSMV